MHCKHIGISCDIPFNNSERVPKIPKFKLKIEVFLSTAWSKTSRRKWQAVNVNVRNLVRITRLTLFKLSY